MIEPGHRTIVDVKGKPLFRLLAERQTNRRLDGSAMANRDHVVTRLRAVDPLDRAAHAVIEIHKAFAAGWRFADVGKPVAADRPAGDERRAIHALPLSEMLFGEGCFLE